MTNNLMLPLVSSMMFGLGLAAQSQPNATPSLWRTGSPGLGATLQFTLHAAPRSLLAQLLSFDQGPTLYRGVRYPIGADAVAFPVGFVSPTGQPVQNSLSIPNNPNLAGIDVFYAALGVAPGSIDPVAGPAGRFRVHGPSPREGRVVILTEHALDNGHSQVIAAAQRLNTTADELTNDNRTTLVGNPWLPWSARHAGDIVTLPMGQPGSEGLFTLPAALPFPLAAFVAGTVSQPQLDNIPGVMPARNQDLAAMVGQTFVAVVYDSTVGINYRPLLANLQGERCGRLAFTVLDVRLPGSISESNSSTSFYDLLVRIEAPIDAGPAYGVPLRDDAADSIQITEAIWRNGRLSVRATSALGARADMTMSVDGFTFESPMRWNARNAQYEADLDTIVNLVGRRVTISTREGGAYSITVQ